MFFRSAATFGMLRSGKRRLKNKVPDPVWRSPALIKFFCLAAQFELFEDRGVAIEVGALQVVEQLAATGRHGDQAAAGVEVLAVFPEVLGEVFDARGEQCDLHFGRAGVILVGTELFDDFCFINCGIF